MEQFLKRFFFVWLVQFLKKFMISSIIQTLSLKIQPNINEQEKKRQRIYDFLNAKTKPKFLCLPYTKQRKKSFTEKELFNEKEEWRVEQKRKECFLIALAMVIKKDPITSIRKHANKLKFHEKL